MSKAWIAFARNGNPQHQALPAWKPYTLDERETMLLDYTCELHVDVHRETRLAFRDVRSRRLSNIGTWAPAERVEHVRG
jgi:para-nitrobenzyl esterase